MKSEELIQADDDLKRRLSVVFVGGVLLAVCGVLHLLRPGQREIASLAAMLGAAIVAAPIMWDAIKALRVTGYAATKFYMDQYITLAVIACFAVGQYVTGGIVAVILIIGQILEERSVLGVREAVDSLLKLSKVRARRLAGDAEELVDSDTLTTGDRVRVRPGDTIPADGLVLAGSSAVNQASITGESIPVEIEPGSSVFAGTSNLSGLLEIEVARTGDETVLGRVRNIIEEAQNSRAPIMRLAEEYARYYTPLVLIIAAFVLFFTRDISRAISVLIVSIPCAFVLASPSAMVAALASASRLGILVKSARFFEAANEIDTVVFDKTGTLTKGDLQVSRVELLNGLLENDVIALAGSAERHSSHPVARAVLACAEQRGLKLREAVDVQEKAGHGIAAQIDGRAVLVGRASWLVANGVTCELDGAGSGNLSVLHIALEQQLAARIYLRDTVRDEARASIDALRDRGVEHFMMLTGDRQSVAETIASEVGIHEVRAECLPEQKLESVYKLKNLERKVMVVGDGVNDAPALAAGDLGVAMGALGSDVAIKTADIALMSNDLGRLPSLLKLSRQTTQIVNQNILCGFIFIGIAVAVSSLGLVSPILAAFIHEFSAFFVIFNSARLLRFEG